MLPAVQHGMIVLAWNAKYVCLRENDIVVLRDPRGERLLLKRIAERKDHRYFVLGDNEKKSTDSRTFGWIEKKDMLGKVILKI